MDGVIVKPVTQAEYVKIFRKKYLAFKNSPLKDCTKALELLKKYSSIPPVFVPLKFCRGKEEYLYLQIFPQKFKDNDEKREFVGDIRYLRNVDRTIHDYEVILKECLKDYQVKSERTIVLFQLFRI